MNASLPDIVAAFGGLALLVIFFVGMWPRKSDPNDREGLF